MYEPMLLLTMFTLYIVESLCSLCTIILSLLYTILVHIASGKCVGNKLAKVSKKIVNLRTYLISHFWPRLTEARVFPEYHPWGTCEQ